MDSALTSTWGDGTYNPQDRADARLGSFYEDHIDAALLDPLLAYLSSTSAPPGHNPLDNPSLLDSATIDPQKMELPTDECGGEEHYSVLECTDCGKSFAGDKNLK